MNVCRITDSGKGTCCVKQSHPATGKIVTGASSVYAESLQVARSGDILLSDCHKAVGKIISTCTVYAEGMPVACLGDFFTGCFTGKLIEGCGSVYAGSAFAAGTEGTKFKVKGPLNLGPSQGAAGPAYNKPIPKTEKLDEIPPPVTPTPPVACMAVSDPPPGNFQLSPNFILSDLSTKVTLPQACYVVSSQAGLTTQEIVCNLQGWCENVGEALVAHIGGKKNMWITSGFRKGSGSSQHHRGQAVDVQFPYLTNPQVWEIALWIKANVPFDQLIIEYGGRRPWLHISFNRAGNRPASAGNKVGTQNYGVDYTWGSLALKYGNDDVPTKKTT